MPAGSAIDLPDGGAVAFGLDAVFGDVAVGADAGIERRPVRARHQALGPVVVDRSARQFRQRRACRCDLGIAFLVGISHDTIGVGDVKVFADQRHAERRMQMIEEHALGSGPTASGVMQQRDPVARSGIAARSHPRLHPCHYEILGPQAWLRAGRLSTQRPEHRHSAARKAIADAASRWRAPRSSVPAQPSASRPASSPRLWPDALAATDIGSVREDWDAGRSAPWDRRPGRYTRSGTGRSTEASAEMRCAPRHV